MGYQIAVAVVDHMSRYNFGSSLSEAQRFARFLHDEWGVGYDNCQNGILMFVSLGDRHMFISTGAVAKKVLTNDKIDSVIGRMKPLLKKRTPTIVCIFYFYFYFIWPAWLNSQLLRPIQRGTTERCK